MKKAVSVFTTVLISGMASIFGQSGNIQFEEVRKIEIKLEGEMAQMMKDMPKEQRSEKTLYFSPEATLYQKSETKEAETSKSFAGHEGAVVFSMSSGDNKVFVDLTENKMVEQREFMTRMFLIENDLEQGEWKISGNQKMILEYPCMEASKTDTAGVVTTVWFAPSFPVKGGPGQFCTLPGMVLEVTIGDAKQQYIAKVIDMTPPDKELFKRPKEGKKVTREEFDKTVAEKMEEMGGESSGGNVMMIRIKR
jgi:GLPGLI family protein